MSEEEKWRNFNFQYVILFQTVESVEMFDITEGKWFFTTPLPRPLTGGTITVSNENRLFYFGGTNDFSDITSVALEFVPKRTDFFKRNSTVWVKKGSEWRNHDYLNINNIQPVALTYEMYDRNLTSKTT